MAVVQYDGTDYEGFQVQRDRPSIQGALEDALERVTQERIRLIGAGRTDAGVHARAQVVSFQAGWQHAPAALMQALNANLPPAIALQSLSVAGDAFDARRSAKSRTYRYSINNQAARAPLRDRYAWHVSAALDERAMHQALQVFVGKHDFIALGNPPRQGKSSVREIFGARCWREVDWVIVELTANAFLHGMVRRIVGALVRAGLGNLSAQDCEQLLAARDKNLVKWKAAPQGLCLWSVEY